MVLRCASISDSLIEVGDWQFLMFDSSPSLVFYPVGMLCLVILHNFQFPQFSISTIVNFAQFSISTMFSFGRNFSLVLISGRMSQLQQPGGGRCVETLNDDRNDLCSGLCMNGKYGELSKFCIMVMLDKLAKLVHTKNII